MLTTPHTKMEHCAIVLKHATPRPIPIHTLPDELLLQIFLRIVHARPLSWNPWKLASVCSRWWYHFLDHPQLWSYVTFASHICEKDGRYNVGDVERAYLQLERSKTCNLFINANRLCHSCPSQLAKFQALITQSHRWEEASFQWPYTLRRSLHAHDDFARIFSEDMSFPKLRKLKWLFPHGQSSESGRLLKLLLRGDPSTGILTNLHSLSLSQMIDPLTLSAILLAKLTYLDLALYNGSIPNLLLLLRDAQALLTFKIWTNMDLEGSESVLGSEGNKLIITLPYLRHLDVIDYSSSRMSHLIIAQLRLPSMSKLSMRFLPHAEQNINAIGKLVQASSSLIKEVHWAAMEYGADISSVLQMCPNLLKLTLIGDTIQDRCRQGHRDLIRALTLRRGSNVQVLCPNLKDLRLSEMKVDPAHMIEMLESRLNHDGRDGWSKVEKLSIAWASASASQIERDQCDSEYKFCVALVKARLEKYRSDGLELNVTLSQFDEKVDGLDADDRNY